MSISEADSASVRDLRILLVAENASIKQGGEGSLAFYYFKFFRSMGVPVIMLLHERSRPELSEMLADAADAIYYVDDTRFQRIVFRVSQKLPGRLVELLVDAPIYLSTQRRQKKLARTLIDEHQLNVVHQPSPIAPRYPSLMYGFGVPVVMGPLCGGMDYPDAFKDREGRLARLLTPVSRGVATFLRMFGPGRLKADALVVAHDNTRRAVPKRARGKIYEVVESGVDLDIWHQKASLVPDTTRPTRFVCLGQVRLLKGTDLLVRAFSRIASSTDATLDIIGDGELLEPLEREIAGLGLQERVRLLGWQSRPEAARYLLESDVLIMPSLKDCGGTVILEAMAVGLPVVAVNWGGPAKYVADGVTGVLIRPYSERQFVEDLAAAMIQLDRDPELRHRYAVAGAHRVRNANFDWVNKARIMLDILAKTRAAYQP